MTTTKSSNPNSESQGADAIAQLAAIQKSRAVIEFNLDGTVIFANDNFLNALGYRLEEVQGQHHRMFLDPAEVMAPEYAAFWQKLNRGEFDSGTYKRIRKDGGEIWIEAEYNPILDENGKPYKVVKFASDVSAAQASKVQAASLHSMIEGTTAMFMTCDADLVITYANPAVVRMLRKYEGEIRKAIPAFDSNKLIGTCIDGFHQNPSHQRRVLADFKNLPTSSELKLGPLTFGVTATALVNDRGEYIGNGVEWSDLNSREISLKEVNRVIDACRSNDLTARGELENLDTNYKPIMMGINDILDSFESALTDVKGPVLEIAGASSQIGEGAQKLAEGASTQASSIEEISASLEQMTSMTQQNADNAGEARNLAQSAQTSANTGNQTMIRMVEAINAIKTSSDQTSKIVKTIDEIAFQTNLLALNAAVEAARAGDAGKGFAVVAEEVRSLAQRSAEAAKNTAELIEGAVKNAENGVKISEEVGGILGEITEGSTKVNDLISEIAAASKEQADGINQVNEAVDQMNRVTQENAANSEESAAASGQLTEQVSVLNTLITSFHLRDTASYGEAPSRQSRPNQAPQRRQPVAAGAGKKMKPQHAIPLDDDEMSDF